MPQRTTISTSFYDSIHKDRNNSIVKRNTRSSHIEVKSYASETFKKFLRIRENWSSVNMYKYNACERVCCCVGEIEVHCLLLMFWPVSFIVLYFGPIAPKSVKLWPLGKIRKWFLSSYKLFFLFAFPFFHRSSLLLFAKTGIQHTLLPVSQILFRL